MVNPMTTRIKQDERGIVSLLVVSILAVVISLVAIGFSHLSNRELQQALDRELSSQAFYAAEAGINDAKAYLAAGGAAFGGCPPPSGSPYFTTSLDGSGVVKYSCISIIDQPKTLSYRLDAGESKVIRIDATALKNLFIGWENQNYTGSPQPLASYPNLPREQGLSSDATGLLRVGIYKVGRSDNSDTNDNLAQSSRFYFLYPNQAGGSLDSRNFGGGTYTATNGPGLNNGDLIKGNCRMPRYTAFINNDQGIASYCNSEITGLDGGSNFYYLYITARYAPLYVRIQGTGSSSNAITFSGSQGVIDVTGKGTDELQRVRARVDLDNQYNWPSEALHSMDSLCKDFSLDLVAQGQYGGANVLDPTDPACQAPSGNTSVTGGGTVGHP